MDRGIYQLKKTASQDSQKSLISFVLLILGGLLILISPNPFVGLYSLIVFIIIFNRLWTSGHFTFFLFCISFQWLQASIKILHANLEDITLTEGFDNYKLMYYFFFPEHSDYLIPAIYLSLTGILVLIWGIKMGKGNFKEEPFLNFKRKEELNSISFKKILFIYIIFSFLTPVLNRIAWLLPSITQIIYAISYLKIAVLFLFLLYLIHHKKYLLLFLVVGFELTIGITSYFSGFKTIIFLLIVAASSFIYSIKFKHILPFVFIGILAFFGAILWTSIKVEYREFLTGGFRTQRVVVSSTSEKIDKVSELIQQTNGEKLKTALNDLFLRLSYIDFFAATLSKVPQEIEFQEGRVWQHAVTNLIPRALFPNKPKLLSDSEHTMRHTGVSLASGTSASFSIGYMGDSYIDFGKIGMFIPIFLLGIMYGKIYTIILRISKNSIVGYSFVVAVLFSMYQLEMASIKLVGRFLMNFIVLGFILFQFNTSMLQLLYKDESRR